MAQTREVLFFQMRPHAQDPQAMQRKQVLPASRGCAFLSPALAGILFQPTTAQLVHMFTPEVITNTVRQASFFAECSVRYGRAPTFLLMTGYEQVRSVVAALAGDWDAAKRVELVLPETGICNSDFDEVDDRLRASASQTSCCGTGGTIPQAAPRTSSGCCKG